jgi:protein-disulfide isomerase
VQQQYDEARLLGVSVTPTMFLNGLRINGTPPLVSLDSLVVQQFRR